MRRLRQAALLLFFGALVVGLFAAPASAAINPQISFQGKLTNPDGTNVTDGNYSIRFRIYTDPTADTGSCANTCKWEETQGTVAVASGLFHVMLGSSTGLPGSVDFNASALYLGVKVGSDAEMTPRIRLSATPQAFNSDMIDGLDSAALGQLAVGQTWTGANVMQPTTNITGLSVKQTSAGSPTADIFNVTTANATGIITVTGPAANEAAVTISSVGGTRDLTLNSGSGTIVLGANTLSRTASGTTTINLVDSSSTLLSVTNTGAGTASINVDGGYQVGGTPGSSVTCSGGQFLQNQVVNGGITTGGTCAAAGGASSNSFTIIDTPSGTDPGADTATDTLQLLATGTNLTITGADNPETVTFDIVESALAGNGLAVNSNALDIATGNGLELNSDAVRVNQDFSFTWTADHTWNLQGTENLDVTSDLAGTVNMLGLVGTPSSTAGTTRGLFIQQAASANTNGLDSGLVIDNADTDLAIATAIEITNSGGFATGITKGIDLNTTGIVTDIELQNAEQIDNNTDDNITFTGTGGTNNETLTIDLDSVGSSGPTLSSAGTHILVNDNLSVGIDGATTENISYAGFAFSGNDLYVDDMLGVNGNAFIDGTLSVLGGTTWDGTSTFNTDVDMTFAGTENLAATSDLAGTVNMLQLTGTPSASAGTTRGIFLQQAASANTNGLDSGIVIDNADTDLALTTAIEITNSGNFATGITKGIDFNATGIVTDIELQNAEQLDNNTDDNVTLTGTGGTNNETFTIDLDSNASSGATLSSGGAFVLINDNLSVGIDGNTTENISYTGFTFSGNDLYVDDMLGVNGNAFLDGTLSVLGAATFDGLTTFNTDVDLALAGTENIAVAHDLAGTVNVLSIIGTPSTTAGTAQGLFIQQANSANSNGFDAGAVVDNADADLALADGILVLSSGFNNGVVDAIDVSAANIQNGINLGSNNIILNSDTINDFTGNGLAVSSSALTVQAAASADALSSTTSSGSGMEVLAGGVALLQGCSDTQILKWNEAADTWGCAADATGSSVDLDAAYDTDADKELLIDNATGLIFDMTTTGDFVIQDSNATIATFSNAGAITFAPGGTSDVTINLDDDSTAILTGTVTNSGAIQDINVTLGNDTGADTVSGLSIDVTSVDTGADSDVIIGMLVNDLTGGNANVTERAIDIGTGWDVGLNVQSGSIITSSKGVEFTEDDGANNPTCAAGNFNIYADLSENKLKKCVNGTTSDIDAGTKEEIVTTTGAGTWTKPADAILVIVDAIGAGGGGGGGSSNTGAVVRTGGAGGGGGAHSFQTFTAANLGSTENFSVGVGGTAGTAGTSGNDGGSGGIGGNTTFGTATLLFAGGGGGGRLGDNASSVGGGGGGGGTGAAGTTGTTAVGAGGGPGTNTAASGGSGGNGSITATAGIGAEWGGGGGGGHTNVPANSAGGTSVRGGGGGGVGGGATVTPSLVNATAGGNVGTFNVSGGGGGGAGTSGAAPTAGTAGAAGNSTKTGQGGGGGGGTITANTTGAAGGAGGAPGGGGGGGGVGSNTNGGGLGGVGGRGELRIWTLRGSGADLAEIYCTNDSDLVAGDVIALDPALRAGVKKTTKAYDSNAIGTVSTEPGLVIGTTEEECAKPVMVALAGRVPVKVSLENGPIKQGDMLTASSTPGMAMKATKAGTAIGQALTAYDGSQVAGYVVAFIKNGQTTGTNLINFAPGLTDGRDQNTAQDALDYFLANRDKLMQAIDLSEITTDRVSAGLEIITPRVTAETVNTNVLQAGVNGDLQIKIASTGMLTFATDFGDPLFTMQGEEAKFDLNLTVADGLTVGGTAKFNGNAFFYKLVTFTEKTVFKNDITIEGHIQTGGSIPTVALEAAAGLTVAPTDKPDANVASVSVNGNDTAGQILLKIGDEAAAGNALQLTFTKQFGKVPRILLTPTNTTAANSKYFVQSTPTGFIISFTDPPDPGTTTTFNYLVVE